MRCGQVLSVSVLVLLSTTVGAARVAVVTPFNAEIDRNVQANTEAAGFEVAACVVQDPDRPVPDGLPMPLLAPVTSAR